ncbi:Cohesin domain protein [Posidoniimonas polymericola]|uniref:Cohesin domain protein n=1 Tax=Posidoniimonas polymericola TaxID=2528002 RepID=A0A5C5ZFH3_9BACT|nr:cohesin domain-containing protein [Posidoniimonas polymericola]TWT85946.1 Cohesin domain protein [Posidoniimonas polymericola]
MTRHRTPNRRATPVRGAAANAARDRKLGLERLEGRLLLASDVYVEDDWIGTTPGADPDGAGPATEFGVDAFATVQEGVNATDPSGFLRINDGAYVENVDVNRAITVGGGFSLDGTLTLSAGGAVLGDGAGTATIASGDLALTSGTFLTAKINGLTPGVGHNQFVVTGEVDLGGATLDAFGSIAAAPGDSVVLIDNDASDAVVGTFAGLANGATVSVNGQDFLVFYDGGDGNDVVLAVPAITDVYVDDDWAGSTTGIDPDGSGPATKFGVDAFDNITDALAAVAVGGTVYVFDGTYTEALNLDREVTLLADTLGGASLDAGGAATGVAVASGVVASVAGFHLSGFVDTGFEVAGNLLLEDSSVAGSGGVGVEIIAGSVATIERVALDGLNTGVAVAGGAILTANTFGGTLVNSVDIRIDPTASSLGVAGSNTLSAADYYIENLAGLALDLSGAPATLFDQTDNFRIEDRLFHAPDDGASGLVRVAAGQLFVTTPGTGASDESIQAAIDAADPGDAIRVEAGLYVGDLSITTAGVELAGAGAGVSILEGVATTPQASFPLASPNINVLAGGVSIHDFTIRSPDVPGGEYASGLLVDSPNVEIYNNEFVSRQNDAAPVGTNDSLTNVAIQTWSGSNSGKASNVDGLSIHDNAFDGGGKGYYGLFVNPQADPVVDAISIADNTFVGNIWRAIEVERSNASISGNTITPSVETLHAWGGSGISVRNFTGDPIVDVTLTGNIITGADGAAGQGFANGVLLGYGAEPLQVAIDASNNLAGHDAGVRINTGDINLVGGTLSGNTTGLVATGGLITVDGAQFSGNTTGVLIGAGAAASLTGSSAAITGGEIGVDLDGGAALVQGYDLNGNTIGVRVRSDGRADLGQSPSGVDFTGLGVSSGGNDFSLYTAPASELVGAVVNLNTGGDYLSGGPQGIGGPSFFDVTAHGNLFSTTFSSQADADTVIYHDVDDPTLGFVDFTGPQDLVVSLDDLPTITTSLAIDEGGAIAVRGEFANTPQAHVVTISWGSGGLDTVIALAEGEFSFTAESPAGAYSDDPDGPNQLASFAITVLVEEVLGLESTADASLSVDVGNVAPSVPLADADGDNQIDEGQQFNLLLGPVIDPGDDAISAYQIDWGDGTPLQFVTGDALLATAAQTHLYTDGLASPERMITVDVLDEDGTWHAAGTLAISVNNVAPTATSFLPFDSVVNEGSTTTVFFAEPYADPGAQDAPLHFAYDFNGNGVFGEAGELGDGAYAGSTATPYAVVPAQFLADDDDGPRAIRGRVIDKDGGFTEYQLTIGIVNVEPVVEAGANDAAFVGAPVDHVVSFTDPGADQDWTVSVDWDGVAGFDEVFTVSSRVFNLKDLSGYTYGAGKLGQTFTVTVQIDDNDGGVDADTFDLTIVEDTLQVVNVAVNPSGVDVRFNRAIDLSVLNLYDGFADSTPDAADLLLVGQNVGPVRGSLLWDASSKTLSFLKTGGVFEADTYTLTLFSGAHTPAVGGSIAFQDTAGADLDGNGDTIAGDDFTTTFVVEPSPRTLGLPDFARGPGQAIDLSPTTTGPGTLELPITLSDANGIYAVDFDLVYDPAVLSVSVPNNNVPLGPTVPSGWNAVGNFIAPGRLRVSVTGTHSLTGANLPIVDLAASVLPTAAYGAMHRIRIENLSINEGLIDSVADEALHKVVFVGDASGSGNYTGYDASLISRVLVGIDSGFEAYDDTDPLIIADVTQDGTISGLDSSLVNREALNRNGDPLQVPEIPPVPAGGVTHAPGLIDPQLSVPAGVLINGDGVVVPVGIDVMPIEEGGVIAATYTLQYDATALSFEEAQLGAATASADGWNIDYYESAPGVLVVSLYGTAAPLPTGAGEISRLAFEVLGSAEATTPLDLEPADAADAALLWTAVDGSIDLSRLAGDYNSDGRVDAADYSLWRGSQGAAVPAFTSADGNGDGMVDNADRAVWRQNYGATLPAPIPALAPALEAPIAASAPIDSDSAELEPPSAAASETSSSSQSLEAALVDPPFNLLAPPQPASASRLKPNPATAQDAPQINVNNALMLHTKRTLIESFWHQSTYADRDRLHNPVNDGHLADAYFEELGSWFAPQV